MRSEVILIVVIAVLMSSCQKSHEQIEEDFRDDFEKFEKLRSDVEKKYVSNPKFKNEATLIFTTCDAKKSTKEICDSDFLELMEALDVWRITVDKKRCNGPHGFGSITFHLPSSKYYVYTFCKEYTFTQTETTYAKSLTDNWYYLVDSSFP